MNPAVKNCHIELVHFVGFDVLFLLALLSLLLLLLLLSYAQDSVYKKEGLPSLIMICLHKMFTQSIEWFFHMYFMKFKHVCSNLENVCIKSL